MSTPSSPIEDPLKRYRSLQAALDLIDQGFTLIDNDLGLLAWNRSFLRLLDFPDTLAFPGAPFEGFIRYNADRGEYGPGDAAAQVAERVEAARRFESHEFERVRPDGTDAQEMTSDERVNWFPHPSPDGKHIAYLAYENGVTGHPAGKDVELRLMSSDGGRPRTLVSLFGGQGTINVPSWSPDSRQFAYVRYA